MGAVVITAAEVFSEGDLNHPVATIKRVGGGKYKTTLLDGDAIADKVDAPDFDTAVAQASAHAVELDNVATTPKEKLALSRTLKEQAATIADLEATIADLQANAVKVIPASSRG